MVFIVLGAVKAAKHAKNEYHKDKKRNNLICPVDGSHDMIADRAASSQSHPTGSTEWWGTSRATGASAPTCDASWNPNLVGAWSRDAPIQPRDDESVPRPTSVYASSASASTELSAATSHSPQERSASLSRLDTVKPPSQRNEGMETRPRPSSMDTPSKPSPGGSEGLLPVRLSSQGLDVREKTPVRDFPDIIDSSRRASSRRDDSNTTLSTKDNNPAVPIKSMEEVEQKTGHQRGGAKASVQGSFAEAMQKPTASKPTASNSKPQPSGATISALAPYASKGLRRTTGQIDNGIQGGDDQVSPDVDGNLSALHRNAPRDHRKRWNRTGGLPNVHGKDGSAGSPPFPETVPHSALARKASKGFRRRVEPLTDGSAKLGLTEIDAVGNDKLEGKQENTKRVDGQPKETRAGVSAFAGAPTKKRSKRFAPVKQLEGEALKVVPSVGTSDSHEPQAEPIRSSTSVTGSSMYAAGTMKKRNSRR